MPEIYLLPEHQQFLKQASIDLQKKVDTGHMQEGCEKHFPHCIVIQQIKGKCQTHHRRRNLHAIGDSKPVHHFLSTTDLLEKNRQILPPLPQDQQQHGTKHAKHKKQDQQKCYLCGTDQHIHVYSTACPTYIP